MPRAVRILFPATAGAILLLLAITAIHHVRHPATILSQPLPEPLAMADHLDTFTLFTTGTFVRTAAQGERFSPLVLSDARNQFPRTGHWISPEMATQFGAIDFLPSYNPHCPPETGVRLDLRTRDAKSGRWSPWLYLGSWGKVLSSPDSRTIQTDTAKVHIDYLTLSSPADAYQARVTFHSFSLDPAINPTLRRLNIHYSGPLADAPIRPVADSPIPPSFDIPVPFRAQGAPLIPKPLRPEICSPTSVSMVMQYFGIDQATPENALAIYDAEYDLFGNWGRAVAYAGQHGLDAHLRRFRNFDDVRAVLAQGQPLIASIRFKKGQCPSFVFAQSAGHLLVIRGYSQDGRFIVNDPASQDKGERALYAAEDMQKAWLTHGGVAYIIRRR